MCKISVISVILTAGTMACSGPSKKANLDQARGPASRKCEETKLNQECFHGGSPEAEQVEFQDFALRIREDIERQDMAHPKKDETGSNLRRGFHAKNQACLEGELQVYGSDQVADPTVAAKMRYGIFTEPRGAGNGWPIWVRFSNGVGWIQHDGIPDVRGMAVKVMGVSGPKFLPDEGQTQDFLMTNSPVPIGSDAADFMKFAEANSKGTFKMGKFIEDNLKEKISTGVSPDDGLPLKPQVIKSMALLRYWSGSPYALGPDQAIKFQVKPVACSGEKKNGKFPDITKGNYLKDDIIKRAKKGICFEFYVQFQTSIENTPLEDNLIEWKEEISKPVAIGRLVLEPQIYKGAVQDKFCDKLSFNPWHAIADHRPLGHMNRARRVVYDKSRELRGGGYEPKDRRVPTL